MRKAFLKASIFSLLVAGSAVSFTSCKDYDDDITNLQNQIDAVKKDLATIQDMVSKGAVITSVTQSGNGVTIALSNGNTYNITNGKDGANGKDADVWTIEKTADGYFWAKNGTVTTYPAQGPAGEAGEAGTPGATGATGNYFAPNAETGKFDEYKADGTLVGATDISWKATVEQTLTAVDNGSTVTIYGLKDKDGKELEPQVLAKTGTLQGLTLVPDLYVNGIETMRTEDASGAILKENKAAVTATTPLTNGTGTATVKADQVTSFVNKGTAAAPANYSFTSINTVTYILNPNNANIDDVEWSFYTNDATVESRSSKAVLNVESAKKNEEGNLVVAYTVAKKADLAPNATNPKQTMAALQATLADNSVVSSDFVAVESQNISFDAIVYNQNGVPTTKTVATNYVAQPVVKTTLEQAINPYSLQVPYNATFNIAEHVAVTYSNGIYTLADLASKYGLSMSYSILNYTQGSNGTAENMYGAVNATTGVFTPMYVNAAGQSVSAVDAGESGRSAIDRQPVVILELTDANGNIVLGGFIKLLIVQKATVNEPINAGSVTVPYLCNNITKSVAWDVIAGQVVEEAGMSVAQFQQNYKLQGTFIAGTNGYVKIANVDGSAVATPQYNYYGSYAWGEVQGGSQTQTLVLTVTPDQVKNYYATFNTNNSFKEYAISASPVTKQLYAGFLNEATNNWIYIGNEVTVIGKPTVSYNGQLESQWAQNYTVAPLNPAVAANANQTVPSVASKMTFTFASLWNGFNPKYSTSTTGFNFGTTGTNPLGATLKTTYTFSATQPTITGASGKKYNFLISADAKTLYAYEVKANQTAAQNDANKQTVATITDGENGGSFLIEASNGVNAQDIVNANAFNLNNPATLFNVDMNLTYGTCEIALNKVGSFKVGVGRPLDVVNPDEIVEITDASGDYTRILGTLTNIKDWQNQNLWKATYKTVNNKPVFDGFVANETVNGVNLWDFWMAGGNITFGGTDAYPVMTNTTASHSGWTKLKDTRAGFDVKFSNGENTVEITDVTDLNTVEMVYENNSGNSVTNAFYIFVPVVANYVWGTSNIGYATVKILPTQTSVN